MIKMRRLSFSVSSREAFHEHGKRDSKDGAVHPVPSSLCFFTVVFSLPAFSRLDLQCFVHG